MTNPMNTANNNPAKPMTEKLAQSVSNTNPPYPIAQKNLGVTVLI